jgi:hypothetical protein
MVTRWLKCKNDTVLQLSAVHYMQKNTCEFVLRIAFKRSLFFDRDGNVDYDGHRVEDIELRKTMQHEVDSLLQYFY